MGNADTVVEAECCGISYILEVHKGPFIEDSSPTTGFTIRFHVHLWEGSSQASGVKSRTCQDDEEVQDAQFVVACSPLHLQNP